MPDTQTVELRTDTIEQLVDLLQYDKPDRATDQASLMPMERRWAVADRFESQLPSMDAIALCGLPGAGKSFVTSKLMTVFDTISVSMGDAVRRQYSEQHGEKHGTSDDLGEFAAMWRSDDSEEIPKKTFEIANEHDENPVIIDGVRSMTDVEVLRESFNNFHLIEVKTPFYERLERIQSRDRDNESTFDIVDLARRDTRELNELGFKETRESNAIDFTIMNRTGGEPLPILLSNIVENNLPYDIADGRPLGLDDELEQFRKKRLT